MESFIALKQLIEKLTPHEIGVVKNFIVAFNRSTNAKNNKSLKLFKLIVDRPEISAVQAKKRVESSTSKASFLKLISRLENKILDTLHLDVNIKKKNAYSPWYTEKLIARKKLMAIETLYGRGENNIVLRLLSDIEKKGKQFEFFDELETINRVRQEIIGLNSSKSIFEKYKEEAAKYRKYDSALKDTIESYYTWVFLDNITSNKRLEKGLREALIRKVHLHYATTKSKSILKILLTLKIEHHEAEGNFLKAREDAIQHLNLIKKNPDIFIKRRLAEAYGRLGRIEVYLLQLEEAKLYLAEAKKNFPKKGKDYTIVSEYLFLTLLYSNRIDDCIKSIPFILLNYKNLNFPKGTEKSLFYKANAHFANSEFKKAFHALQDLKHLEKDKSGWNLGIRFLAILCLIEMDKMDLVEARIESTRKFIQRVQKTAAIRKRDLLVFEVLKALEKNSFDFQKTQEIQSKNLDLLASDKSDCRWEILNHELIVFHQWFEAKLNNKPYRFKKPVQIKEKRANQDVG